MRRDVDQFVARGMFGRNNKRMWQERQDNKAYREGPSTPGEQLDNILMVNDVDFEQFRGLAIFAAIHEASWRLHIQHHNSFSFSPCDWYERIGLKSKVQFMAMRIPILSWQKDMVSAMQTLYKQGRTLDDMMEHFHAEDKECMKAFRASLIAGMNKDKELLRESATLGG